MHFNENLPAVRSSALCCNPLVSAGLQPNNSASSQLSAEVGLILVILKVTQTGKTRVLTVARYRSYGNPSNFRYNLYRTFIDSVWMQKHPENYTTRFVIRRTRTETSTFFTSSEEKIHNFPWSL